MSNCVRGGAPWLSSGNDNCCTIVEGAEVVRTAVVSYETPVLHQVFVKNSSPPYRTVISGSKQNHCYSFKNHFSTSSSSEAEDKSLLSRPCVPTSDRPLNTRLTFRKKVDSQLDAICSEAHLYSSSSIKLPSSFTLSALSPSSKSSVPSSEAGSSWSSSSSSSSSPLSLSPEVSAFTLPLVSLSVIPNVSLPTNASLSSPSSPSQALNLSASSPPLREPRPDDELTSLSWLQDSNLLRGTTLTSLKPNKTSSLGRRHRPTKKDKNESVATSKSSNSFGRDIEEDSKEESPFSDSIADESTEELEKLQTCPPTSNQPVPYNSKIHTMAKPPFSFSCLIFMAIEESSSKALPVKDIYTWIVDHYPYYKSAPTGWKNSVRHNLSLNKCFSKVEKAPSLGKGSLWMVDPSHRPNLLQAMSKAPFTSLSPLDRTFTLSSKVVVNPGWHYKTSQKPQETEGKYILGEVTHKLPGESLNGPLRDPDVLRAPMYRKPTSAPKLRIPTRQYHRNITLDNKFRKINHTTHCSDKNKLELGKNINNNMANNRSSPNPELFPRLAKRLELNSLYEPHVNADSYAIDVQIEDVDAATAMLVLKHGPQMLSPLTETCYQLRKNQNSSLLSYFTGEKRKRNKHSECNADDPKSMYINSSPSVEHSYVCPQEDGSLHESVHYDLRAERSPLFQGMIDTYDENIKPITSEITYHEHPSDEASALFNLASIASQLASRRDEKNRRRSPVRISYSDETQTLFPETQPETQLNKTSKRNSKRKLPTKNVNKLNKSEFAFTVNSRISSRKLYKPKAKMFSLELDSEYNIKTTKVAKSRYNNNSKDVVNRNKFLKVKKLCMRSRKAC